MHNFKPYARQTGFILMPTISIFLLLAMVAYLLNSSNNLELHIVQDENAHEPLGYVMDAAEAHFLWLNNQQSCVNYTTLTNVAFGADQYSATPVVDNGSPIDVTLSATSQSGNITTAVREMHLHELPVSVAKSAIKDSYIRQANPNNNYGSATTLLVDGTPGAAQYPLLQFDVSTLPFGAEVVSATLDLYVESTGTSTSGGTIIAYPMKAGWAEPAVSYASGDGFWTWNFLASYQATNPSTAVLLDPATPGGYQWDVSGFVQPWIESGANNRGLTLVGSSQVKGVSFTSRSGAITANRPQLNITYRVACGAGTGPVNNNETVDILMRGVGYGDTLIAKNKDELNFGSVGKLQVGLHDTRRTLLLPNLSPIPAGALIVSAKLRLFLENQGKKNSEKDDPIIMELFPLTVPWVVGTNDGSAGVPNNGASWNERTATLPWTADGAEGDYRTPNVGQTTIPFAATNDWVQVDDITAIVQEWVDGVTTNYGLILTGTHGNTQNFSSDDDIQPERYPRIEVVYAPP